MSITENSLASISSNTRKRLEHLSIGDVSDWDAVFSNGYGVGSNDTLVIDIRSQNGAFDIDKVIASKELLEAIVAGIHESGSAITSMDFGINDNHHSFLVIVGLK